MNQQEYYVAGITHVDLAWKRGQDEMSEMLEIVIIRILDALEHNPDFKYLIEQAAHFRILARRRPDLIERLRPFLQSGRLEFMGGMASTLENNLPNGECFVRNQQMGLQWVRKTWDIEVKTGWLVDTFGINAQVPQILRGFGLYHLLANRFGGNNTQDLFSARGIDGSEITVGGWGTYAAYVCPENLSSKFCKNWDDIETCFAKADTLTGPGPFLVLPYTENEMLISLYPMQLQEKRNKEQPGQTWRSAVPKDFFAALDKTKRTLPVVHGDLNPEFTGCFSLRHPIRLRNRVVENRLLEAEKWAALAELTDSVSEIEEAWWKLAYVQFHDVFTGSHPTPIFHEVMQTLDDIETAANAVLQQAFSVLAPTQSGAQESPDNKSCIVSLFNGLPWKRQEIADVPLPSGWNGISRVTSSDGTPCAFEIRDGHVRILTETPSVGHCDIRLEAGKSTNSTWAPVTDATLENDWIQLDLDRTSGIAKLTWKPTGAVLLEDAGSWLVVQSDSGNFQIENPSGPEIAASSGTLTLESLSTSALGQTARLSGEFPPMSWAGPDSHLSWEAEFFLPANEPVVQLSLNLDWKGEASRIRLTLPTLIDTSTGIYEIPFGVVKRKPYSPRTNAKGEWPAHQFVALEDSTHGIALANTGVGGVEVNGGTLYTTLLRAPKGEYAGMVSDETSSQHGKHSYRFDILPYTGSWADAGVARFAQQLNQPILSHTRLGQEALPSSSYLSLEPAHIVLSSIKAASDGSSDLIVRVYETAGHASDNVVLRIPGDVVAADACDLQETPGAAMELQDGSLRFSIQPFEIRSMRLKRGGED